MKKIILIACLALLYDVTYSQGTNWRAQGKYYSAKERYENKEYESALDYIYDCKELLEGTNYVLQYLHIVSAYYGGNYEEAQKELETFFRLVDEEIEPVDFSKDVLELTQDETRELTKLIDKIDESVEYEKEENYKNRSYTGTLKGTTRYGNDYEYYGPISNQYGNGKGKITYETGWIYVGEIRNSKPHGWGKLTKGEFFIEANWAYGLPEGKGTYKLGNSQTQWIYDGYFENGQPHNTGKGSVINNGSKVFGYSGEFNNGYLADGTLENFQKNHKLSGNFRIYGTSKMKFTGDGYVDGKWHSFVGELLEREAANMSVTYDSKI